MLFNVIPLDVMLFCPFSHNKMQDNLPVNFNMQLQYFIHLEDIIQKAGLLFYILHYLFILYTFLKQPKCLYWQNPKSVPVFRWVLLFFFFTQAQLC